MPLPVRKCAIPSSGAGVPPAAPVLARRPGGLRFSNSAFSIQDCYDSLSPAGNSARRHFLHSSKKLILQVPVFEPVAQQGQCENRLKNCVSLAISLLPGPFPFHSAFCILHSAFCLLPPAPPGQALAKAEKCRNQSVRVLLTYY